MSSGNMVNVTGSTGDGSLPTVPTSPAGIYGWRKRCLYALVFILLVTVIINIALTVWIIRVMNFSVHGMGKLRIVDNGMRLEGDAKFLKALFARKIFSTRNSGLEIQSDKNITLFSQDKKNHKKNSLFLGNGKLQAYADKLEIFNSKGKLLFAADNKSVAIGAKSLSGAETVLSGYLQTPLIRSHRTSALRIESPARSIQMVAGKNINMRATNGAASAVARDGITLQSISEHIMLDAKNITMKGIPLSETTSNGEMFPLVYQLCVCGNNGKLFLSQSMGTCQATVDICS